MKSLKRIIAGVTAGVMVLGAAALPEMPFDFSGIASVSAEAVTGTYGDLTYEIVDGEVIITGCDRSSFSINIPSEIEGYPVTGIGDQAFHFFYKLEKIIIPETVVSIGVLAFTECHGLNKIVIPDSVINIGEGAFSNCKNLADIQISDSVIDIGYNAFQDTAWLRNYTGDFVIVGDGVLYQYKGSGTRVVIPKNVKYIEAGSFSNYTALTGVDIPDSVIRIGYGAFKYCTSLEELTIPSGVASIGEEAFLGCDALANINVSDNNLYYSDLDGVLFNKEQSEIIQYPIGKKASSFYKCISLKKVIFNQQITSIGDYAFYGCISLNNLLLPDKIVSIGDYSFYNCELLTSLDIPSRVTWIGKAAFMY